jgi:mannose-6-phosphate isomerase-like protein (cupin superfamily)
MSSTTSGYTRQNLAEVEDSAPKFGFEGVQEARFAGDRLDAAHTGISYHRILPGKRQAFAHRHDEAEEIYVIVAGSGRMKLDDEIIDVRPLDAVRVAPGVTRQFEAGSERLDFIAAGAKHPGDGELVHDWWTD